MNFDVTKIQKTDPLGHSTFKRVWMSPDEDSSRHMPPGPFVAKSLKITNRATFTANINPIFNEIIFSLGIRHPNCVSATGVTYDESNVILLIEEFQTHLGTGNHSSRDIQRYIYELVCAVTHLHSRRIIHGDIRLNNIFLTKSGVVKLGNYEHSAFILSENTSKFCRKMYVKKNRPAEVWNSTTWGFSADIWALGCTIFELMYGEPLFPVQETNMDYISCLDAWGTHTPQESGRPIRFPHSWGNPDNFRLNNLILMMCNPDPTKRPSIFDIKTELETERDLSIPLSTSPNSVCSYETIYKCEEVVKCIYTGKTFVSPAKMTLMDAISRHESDFASLVMLVYECLSTSPTFDHTLLRVSEIVAHSLTMSQPTSFSVTIQHVDRLKSILSKGNFQFIDWEKLFGVRT